MLKQAFSRVNVRGKLVENTLKEGLQKSDGKPYIAGELKIEVGANNIIPVNMYASKFKKDGKLSKLYPNFVTIMNLYKSKADVEDPKDADDIIFDNGDFSVKSFASDRGDIIDFVQLKGTFPNRTNEVYSKIATFEIEIVIDSIVDEIDKDTEMETGAKLIKGYFIGYNENVGKVTLAIEVPEGISFIESNYKKGDTVKLFGNIINKETKITTKEEQGFGAPIITERTKTMKRFVVTRGSNPYDIDKAYDLEEVKEALIARNIQLKSKVNKPTPATKNAGFSPDDGFNPDNF